ncbi:MAG: hypothetical protein K6B38_14465, partial [Ruminococcus sp.]|nr:hypothetical protein [Ruminococcus sp.]
YCYEHPYFDEDDNKIDIRPKYLTIGATTLYWLGYIMTKELIIRGHWSEMTEIQQQSIGFQQKYML